MEDKLRALHARSLELETQLQVEARGRRSAEEANRELVTGAENARQSIRELQGKVCTRERENALQIGVVIVGCGGAAGSVVILLQWWA